MARRPSDQERGFLRDLQGVDSAPSAGKAQGATTFPRAMSSINEIEHPERIRLTVEFEAALVRELRAAYYDVSTAFFKRKLRHAAIELSDSKTRLGRWVPETRTIEIARVLAFGQPWGVVVEVLKHEMAHQYVHEVLKVTDETAHGPVFRELCERLGIDSSASGMPVPSGGTTGEDSRVLERIARLLALAESSNVHEAQAAMSAAQRLMLKHNLESIASRMPRRYSFRHLGKPTGRVSESERLLGTILSEHFFVEVIWVPVYRVLENKRGSVLEVCGTHGRAALAGTPAEQPDPRQPGSAHLSGRGDGRLLGEAQRGAGCPQGAGARMDRGRGSRSVLPAAASAYPSRPEPGERADRGARARAGGGEADRASQADLGAEFGRGDEALTGVGARGR
jgi:hypothetical protein